MDNKGEKGCHQADEGILQGLTGLLDPRDSSYQWVNDMQLRWSLRLKQRLYSGKVYDVGAACLYYVQWEWGPVDLNWEYSGAVDGII